MARARAQQWAGMLRCAAALAMRDAAALIIMQMDKAIGISKLNHQPLSNVAVSPEPELPEPVQKESQTTAAEDTTDIKKQSI